MGITLGYNKMSLEQFKSLIGRTPEDAILYLSTYKIVVNNYEIKSIRVAKRDNFPLALTMDLKNDRLNVETIDGLITKIGAIG